MVKKKRRMGTRRSEPQKTSRKRKKIKEADFFYSREVAPLRRALRRAQQARHLKAVDDLWERLQASVKHHRILVKRARLMEKP